MKQIIIVVACFFLNMIASVQATEEVQIKQLLSIEISDWNGDGSTDKAVLALPENKDDDGATLYIYLSNDNGGTTIKKRNIAWFGVMWGTIPKLSVNKSGSLLVHSMNESIGRNRWSQTVTLSYRHKEFIVSGYSYSSHDNLKLDNYFKCDVNLLTGKGLKNGKPLRVAVKKRLLQNWNDDQIPKECNE